MNNRSKDRELKKIKDIFPLKHHQISMMYNIMNNQDFYYEKLTYLLKGEICEKKFRNTWAMIVQLNDVLRSIYVWETDNIPLQIVFEEKEIPIFCFKSEEEYDLYYSSQYKIDVSKNAICVFLIRLNKATYKMIIYTHHIVMDGWSHANLLSQFVRAYLDEHDWADGVQPASYKNYMKYYLMQCQDNKAYWLNYIASFSNTNAKIVHSTSKAFQYISYKLSLEDINALACKIGSMEFSFSDVIFSFWGILLQFFYNQKKIIFGVTLSGRDRPDDSTKRLLGMLISTVPIYIDFSEKNDFFGLTQEIKEIKLQHILHQEYDIREINKNLFWNSTVVIQNYPITNKRREKINVELIEHKYKNEMDISLGVRILDNNVFFDYSYASALFSSRDIMFLHECYKKLFNRIAKGYDVWGVKVNSMISILNNEEDI